MFFPLILIMLLFIFANQNSSSKSKEPAPTISENIQPEKEEGSTGFLFALLGMMMIPIVFLILSVHENDVPVWKDTESITTKQQQYKPTGKEHNNHFEKAFAAPNICPFAADAFVKYTGPTGFTDEFIVYKPASFKQ